jgi:hypothetical protein
VEYTTFPSLIVINDWSITFRIIAICYRKRYKRFCVISQTIITLLRKLSLTIIAITLILNKHSRLTSIIEQHLLKNILNLFSWKLVELMDITTSRLACTSNDV